MFNISAVGKGRIYRSSIFVNRTNPCRLVGWLLLIGLLLLAPHSAQANILEDSGTLQFDNSVYTANEGVGSAVFTVTRSGGSAGALTARVLLTNVTTSSADYALVQPGSPDTTFAIGSGANSSIKTLAVQADGKVLIGGSFTTFNGTSSKRIARLNPTGLLDSSFSVGTGASGVVEAIVIQPDGKILLGGSFTGYDGTPVNRVARLNADGTLDSAFAVGAGANGTVYAVALQADGKVLIGGSFTSYNGTPVNRVARLNPTGTLDNTFTVGAGADDTVYALTLQADGKVLIGGNFTNYAGVAANYISRLNPDGTPDAAFQTGTGANGLVQTLALQADGKILLGGQFTAYNGANRNYIARLNADGSLDPSLEVGAGANDWVNKVALQADGKILVGGGFTEFNGAFANRLIRLNNDGSADTSFSISTGTNDWISSLVVQPDGRILLGGFFTSYAGVASNRLARLNNDIFLSWAAGDSAAKTFSLPLVDDSLSEPTEQLSLTLTSTLPVLGQPASARLDIFDNDPVLEIATAISATNGSGQVAPLGAVFAQPLVATVYNQLGSPLGGQVVTFSVPTSGASGNFAGGSVYTGTTNPAGIITSSLLTANNQAGIYTVTATVAGVITPANFVLTNCNPLQVVSTSDEASCGTLRYAVGVASAGQTISLTLTAGSTISLTSGLALPAGVNLTSLAACETSAPPITLLSTNNNLQNGLTLLGNNSVYGIWLRGFGDKQLVAYSGGNILGCLKISKT